MNKNRVVITGYGLTTAIGHTPQEVWHSLVQGKIGIKALTRFDASQTSISNVGEIRDFPFNRYFANQNKERYDLSTWYALYAANAALEHSGLGQISAEDQERTGVYLSTTVGGLKEFQDEIIAMDDHGLDAVKPTFLSKALYNMLALNVAAALGAKGSSKCIATACSSSNDAIGQAFRDIKYGNLDMVLAGGAEAPITEIGLGGFDALTAVSRTKDPSRSSIPFDKDRNGFVMGEGAGLLVLESLDHAQKRGAKIFAEIIGYGSNCDAYHLTSPSPNGIGAKKALQLALREADLSPDQVDYINAHGTSTPANDLAESQAIVSLFGRQIPVSSTKSFTGHLQGATGAVEAIITIEALRHNYLPMTAGTKKLDPDVEANIILGQGQEADVTYALSNTFGFGGDNAVLAFKKWQD